MTYIQKLNEIKECAKKHSKNQAEIRKLIDEAYFLGRESRLELTSDKKQLLDKVIKASGLTIEELREKYQGPKMVDIRSIVYYHLRPIFTFEDIGKIFGKAHATVMHSVQRYKNLYQYDREFRITADNFIKRLQDEN
jgi:chromosomal replication initiation ATPase DnaA